MIDLPEDTTLKTTLDLANQDQGVVMPSFDSDVTVIYENDAPHGLRNKSGYQFFFPKVTKFSGQEERYQRELEEQRNLARYLVSVFKAHPPTF